MAAAIEDFDQFFKALFAWFFELYIRLFYPVLVPYLDFGNIEYPTGEFFFEMFADCLVPRRFTDFIAKIALTPAGLLFFNNCTELVFLIEPEKGTIADLRPRMRFYHAGASARYPKAFVMLTGLYIDVALEGLGEDHDLFGNENTVQDRLSAKKTKRSKKSTQPAQFGFPGIKVNSQLFSWPYVGLPGLKARDYLEAGKDNMIVPGLIGFMKIQPHERSEIFIKSILQINEYKIDLKLKNHLARGLFLGMKLSPEEELQFKKTLRERPEFQRTETMIMTWFDEAEAIGEARGKTEGEAKGKVEGAQGIVISLLNHRFGSLSQNVLDHVKTMKPKQLENLSVKLLNASYGLKELGLVNGAVSNPH